MIGGMKTIMKLNEIKSIEQMSLFLTGSQAVAFQVASSKKERYGTISYFIRSFHYKKLKRSEKGIMIQFLCKVTAYSRQQMTRLIKQYLKHRKLVPRQKTTHGFSTRYTRADKTLLASIDKLHDTPNGLMVKKLCERAYHQFEDLSYERLSHISVSHIYNLRQSNTYKVARGVHFTKTTKGKSPHIGERKKPETNGEPGYIRIDTVHQGDLNGKKGVYHINAVDEVTQYEVILSVEKISEAYLLPILEEIIELFPFKIINFHSDNGSEYINKCVAKMLKKLLIKLTKSRPRKSTDNALVEGKNGAIVRKVFGYTHMPQRHAAVINDFNKKALIPYLNFHRPCLFAVTKVDHKGKQKKTYPYQNMMTPYEKFKSLKNAKTYLKNNISFEILDAMATEISDNKAAERLQITRQNLFNIIHGDCKKFA